MLVLLSFHHCIFQSTLTADLSSVQGTEKIQTGHWKGNDKQHQEKYDTKLKKKKKMEKKCKQKLNTIPFTKNQKRIKKQKLKARLREHESGFTDIITCRCKKLLKCLPKKGVDILIGETMGQ